MATQLTRDQVVSTLVKVGCRAVRRMNDETLVEELPRIIEAAVEDGVKIEAKDDPDGVYQGFLDQLIESEGDIELIPEGQAPDEPSDEEPDEEPKPKKTKAKKEPKPKPKPTAPKTKKLSRRDATTQALVAGKKGLTFDEIVAAADALYVEGGGKPNGQESIYMTKLVVGIGEGLGVITEKGGKYKLAK